LPAPIIEVDTPPPESTLGGTGPSDTVAPGTLPGVLPGDDPLGEAEGDVDGDFDPDGDGDGDGDAAVTATVSDAAGGVHCTEGTMLAVAISFTELTELALAATGICAWRLTGCLSVTEVNAHSVPPLPLAQPLVKLGCWPAGSEVSVRSTPETGPFCVETVTAYWAFWPRWMLVCEVCTVTHSSAGFGSAAMAASSEAEEEAEADAEAEAEAEAEGDGDWLGVLLGSPPPEAEEDVGEGESEGDGDGLGEGDAVLGTAWHVVSVFVAAAARRVVSRSPCESACAVPGRLTSPPRRTKLPASKPAVAVRTCL
jgi:hypothetical protein